MNPHLQKIVAKGSFLRQQMWKESNLLLSRKQAFLYSLMRVSAITFGGLKENRLLSRAAALSFSSLLGLGPLIALAVLVSGFVLDQTQPDMAQKAIEQSIAFVAPQVNLDSADDADGTHSDLSDMISRFIAASQSGSVGIGGTFMLVLIVLQLFTTIEDAFNDIWGVRRGRNIMTRVILYWTIITLGALLVFAGLAIIVSRAMEMHALSDAIAGGGVTRWLSLYGAKLGGFLVITTVLTLFYRFIPNTQVEWKCSFLGALFAVACFALNNMFAFLYIERVAMQRTLYGSLGVLPVLMIGLYFFWVCLLLGGRVAFAIQNARFKGGKIAWDGLSLAAQEGLCLLLLTQICRQFQLCQPPLSASQLAAMHGLPSQLATAAMNRLLELELASPLPPSDDDSLDAYRYQPAKPLDRILLIDFKRAFESFGEAPDEDNFDGFDPVVRHFHDGLRRARQDALGDISMDDLLQELPPYSEAATLESTPNDDAPASKSA